MFERAFAASIRADRFYAFSKEEDAVYIDQIAAEVPAVRWWAEQALHAERKRLGQRSQLDAFIEDKIEAEPESVVNF